MGVAGKARMWTATPPWMEEAMSNNTHARVSSTKRSAIKANEAVAAEAWQISSSGGGGDAEEAILLLPLLDMDLPREGGGRAKRRLLLKG